MDRIECKSNEMIVERKVRVKMNPAFPRYALVCGLLKRLLSPDGFIEELENGEWVEEKHQH